MWLFRFENCITDTFHGILARANLLPLKNTLSTLIKDEHVEQASACARSRTKKALHLSC